MRTRLKKKAENVGQVMGVEVVRQLVEQSAPLFEREFDVAAVADAGAGLFVEGHEVRPVQDRWIVEREGALFHGQLGGRAVGLALDNR